MQSLETWCVLDRRGYRAGATAAEGVTARSGGMIKKGEDERSTEMAAWVPDPVTGYYRPEKRNELKKRKNVFINFHLIL